MFLQPYLYYYLVATFFVFLQQRALKAYETFDFYATPTLKALIVLTSIIGSISCLVFLILGFWFMPKWWYPLAFIGLKLATAWLPIPDELGAKLGVALVPAFSVLMYLDLFGII